MGCCSSTPEKGDVEALGKDAPLVKDAADVNNGRPASSTVLGKEPAGLVPVSSRSGSPLSGTRPRSSEEVQKKRPAGLTVGADQLKDPNMIQTTPTPQKAKQGFDAPDQASDTIRPISDRHEEDLNRLAMFIPWEQPPLGDKKKKSKPPTFHGQKRAEKRRKSKRASEIASGERMPGGEKKSKQQVFIPGSGSERMLIADQSRKVSALPPLKFNKVEASSTVKSTIAAERERVLERKKEVQALNRFMKEELGFSADMAKLIRQYAEISKVPATAVEIFEDNTRSHMPTNSRTVISCPVKQTK